MSVATAVSGLTEETVAPDEMPDAVVPRHRVIGGVAPCSRQPIHFRSAAAVHSAPTRRYAGGGRAGDDCSGNTSDTTQSEPTAPKRQAGGADCGCSGDEARTRTAGPDTCSATIGRGAASDTRAAKTAGA